MNIYHYDQTTREYIGQGEATPDPMEPGRWLIPAWATTIEPPEQRAGMVRVFDGSAWAYEPMPAEAAE